MKTKSSLIFCLVLLASLQAKAQYTFEKPLYGAAYYHEYMPYERLDDDIRLMKNAGLSVVRVGESTWGVFEPQEGVFEFEWMDRIIDKIHEAGIKVILGTPTYSIPAWLAYKHPEVLAEHTSGRKAYYGIRQNIDFTNPTFKYYSERIIRKMMERYAQHPGVIGYQVDNETESRGVNNRAPPAVGGESSNPGPGIGGPAAIGSVCPLDDARGVEPKGVLSPQLTFVCADTVLGEMTTAEITSRNVKTKVAIEL